MQYTAKCEILLVALEKSTPFAPYFAIEKTDKNVTLLYSSMNLPRSFDELHVTVLPGHGTVALYLH